MRLNILVSAVAAALVVGPLSVAAQTSNTSSITAVVAVAAGINVTGVSDLTFGAAVPGTSPVIDIIDATAGKWFVSGAAGAEVDLSLVAPLVLTDIGGNAGADIPIAYTAGYSATDVPGSATPWVDVTITETSNLDGTTGELYAWVGGTLTLAANQTPSNYTATVQLTVAYTGN